MGDIEERYQSLSDADLHYIAYLSSSPPKNVQLALKELQIRQEKKESDANRTQNTTKNFTIIIFVLTLLTLIVGIISLFT